MFDKLKSLFARKNKLVLTLTGTDDNVNLDVTVKLKNKEGYFEFTELVNHLNHGHLFGIIREALATSKEPELAEMVFNPEARNERAVVPADKVLETIA